MREKFKIFGIIAGLLFLAAIVVLSVQVCAFDKNFYAAEYARLNTARSIGITEKGLNSATDTLLDYLCGERDDLSVTAPIGGEVREVFNGREKDHMVDVRELYRIALGVMYVGIIAFAALLSTALIKKKVADFAGGYIWANVVFLSIVAAIGVWAVLDFPTFWTTFHKIFFTNDLWILDPRTDILIMMVPGQFFFDLVIKIVLLSVGIIGVLFTCALIVRKKVKP